MERFLHIRLYADTRHMKRNIVLFSAQTARFTTTKFCKCPPLVAIMTKNCIRLHAKLVSRRWVFFQVLSEPSTCSMSFPVRHSKVQAYEHLMVPYTTKALSLRPHVLRTLTVWARFSFQLRQKKHNQFHCISRICMVSCCDRYKTRRQCAS